MWCRKTAGFEFVQNKRIGLRSKEVCAEEMDHHNGAEDEEDRSVPYLFPNDDPIRYTLQVFPQSGWCIGLSETEHTQAQER